MQKPQPMQYLGSINTAPSGESNVAPTGQTCTHGECSQRLHSFGTKKECWISDFGTAASGKPCMPPLGQSTSVSPREAPDPGLGLVMTYRSIQVRKNGPSGTWFSVLHASAQSPQPMHRLASIAIIHLCIVGSYPRGAPVVTRTF